MLWIQKVDRVGHLHFKYSKYVFFSTCRIPQDALFVEGSLPETAYNVVKDQEYCGEIKVALTFTAEVML